MRTRSQACLAAVVLTSAAWLVGCSDDPTAFDECAAFEQQLAETRSQLAAAEAERDELSAATADLADQSTPFDLDAIATAWGSGDADEIRAFYTDDAVMMPFGHILATLGNHPVPEYWDVAGPDMDREALEHEGGTFEYLTVDRIGNMVVATGQWTFPEALDPSLADTVIQTADIWHLRGDKIWRHFADFEVYVGGNLIDM